MQVVAVADLVSIVIPCHNQAHFLADAIESVLAQTYRPIETLVVNDGSTDATAEVAARFPSVRCLTQTRGGLAAARNAGLRESRGRYILFLDADDRLLPGAVKVGWEALAAHADAAAAVGHYRMIGPDGAVLREWPWEPPEADVYAALLRRNYVGMHAAVLYRREIVQALGGFDTRLPACEDYDLLLRLALRHPVANHGILVAQYRWHEGNMSRDFGLMIRSALSVLHAQRPIAMRSAAHRRAFREGQAFWRRYYGARAAARLGAGRGGRQERGQAARDLMLLARFYRRGLLSAARHLLRRWIGRSGPRARERFPQTPG